MYQTLVLILILIVPSWILIFSTFYKRLLWDPVIIFFVPFNEYYSTIASFKLTIFLDLFDIQCCSNLLQYWLHTCFNVSSSSP